MCQRLDGVELLMILYIGLCLFRLCGLPGLKQLYGQRFVIRSAKMGIKTHKLVFLCVYMTEQCVDAGSERLKYRGDDAFIQHHARRGHGLSADLRRIV